MVKDIIPLRQGGASTASSEKEDAGDTKEAAYGRMQALLALRNPALVAQPSAEGPSIPEGAANGAARDGRRAKGGSSEVRLAWDEVGAEGAPVNELEGYSVGGAVSPDTVPQALNPEPLPAARAQPEGSEPDANELIQVSQGPSLSPEPQVLRVKRDSSLSHTPCIK